ncbi:MFS transporter [Vibrio parahaemolyticus]|uniref:MFS transporter n=1 Tax=Vibrio mediterranei TaxID=689 RepID=UPI004067BCB9
MNKKHLWQLSQASMGIVQWIGIAVVIAPLIISRTGSGIVVGQVMMILGLCGLVAPVLGALADRYDLHRQFHLFALISHCAALLLLLLASDTLWHYWGIAALIGVGSNLLLILNPTYALRLNPCVTSQTHSLKRLFQLQMFGVMVAGTLIGVLDYVGFGSSTQLIALLALDLVLLLVIISAPPKKIVLNSSDNDRQTAHTNSRSKSLWFGFVLCVLLSMFVGSNMVEMGPVIIEQGFGVSMSSSSFGMAMAAAVTLIALHPAGRWMEKHGSHALWFVTILINLMVGAGIWLMYGHTVTALLPLSLVLISIVNGAWNDISIAALADELSPYSPATSQGFMAAAVSMGFSFGTFIVGYFIDKQSLTSVMNFLALSGIAITLLASGILIVRKRARLAIRAPKTAHQG